MPWSWLLQLTEVDLDCCGGRLDMSCILIRIMLTQTYRQQAMLLIRIRKSWAINSRRSLTSSLHLDFEVWGRALVGVFFQVIGNRHEMARRKPVGGRKNTHIRIYFKLDTGRLQTQAVYNCWEKLQSSRLIEVTTNITQV